MASIATAAGERASIEAFRRDVVEASLTALVLVDFWAEWCGPCKTLTPLLERVVASYEPRVKLVKIDVDKNQALASQFRVQSIPTVYAFLGGQPVDGFAGALGERELKAFIDRLLSAAPPGLGGDAEGAAELDQLIQAGEAALAEGALVDAVEIFAALLAESPDNAQIAAGYARAMIAAGRLDQAAQALDALPPEAASDAVVGQARAALALARDAGQAGDTAQLRQALAQNPDDHQARFDLANALLASGNRDAAADELLDIIRRDREWNEGAARERLLKLFEAQGLDDPWVLSTRRKLSAILFS